MDCHQNREQAVNHAAVIKKEYKLEELLLTFNRVLVAFSGGVDSTYLLGKTLEVLGREQVLAVTVLSALTPDCEVEEAASFALKLNAHHCSLDVNIIADHEFKANSPERCYICKRIIFGKLFEIAEVKGCHAVFDGSNADDLSDYRPGLRAAWEMGVRSPLQEVNLAKDEIRYLSRLNGYPGWDKPATACLASRLPYGEPITVEKLKRVAAAESFLREVGVKGDLRVRCHGNLARLEVNSISIECILKQRESITAALQKMGFEYISLDLSGFKSGSMNR